jgi:kynurenine formamidase
VTALLDRLLDVEIYDLAHPLSSSVPASPNHPGFRMALMRRHGDGVREDGGSAANELIVTGGHVGTHVDALGHVSHEGKLYGGASAIEAQIGGRLKTHGIDALQPLVARGLLLDVPTALGLPVLEPAHPIGVEELEAAEALTGTNLRNGDVALIRTGWSHRVGEPTAYVGHETGVPGPTPDAARWLVKRGIAITGSDTLAYERIPPGEGHRLLPVHRILLVEHGINIVEVMNLERLAADRVLTFAFVLAPLNIVGATGSPVRPLALVERSTR